MQDTVRRDLSRQLLMFVRNSLLEDAAGAVEADTPLVSSGLVDSFDLVELLSEVERISGRSLPVGRMSPQDLESVDRILDFLERCESAS